MAAKLISPQTGCQFLNPLTLNPYCTKSLPCAEGLGGAAAERNKRFFPKITARLVFKIKSSFFSHFLVNGDILSCKCQKCKKNNNIIYIYVELCYSENEMFHIFMYITAAVRQTANNTEFNYFLSYSTQNCKHFCVFDFTKRLHQTRENITTIRSGHKHSFSPRWRFAGGGRMRAIVEEYWNMAAILEYFQNPSRRAIQIFCLRDRKLILRNFLKKLFTDDVNNVDSGQERHFWTTLKPSIRRKRVKSVDFFDNPPLNAMAYLRDWWSFLGMVFVGQCEVFVYLGFVEIISFLYFSLVCEAHRSANGVSIP